MGAEYLFYKEPIQVTRGEGVWLYDEKGERYLDCYNNVACLGHGNTALAEALAGQFATINTHNRYLDELIVHYAEQLLGEFPASLDKCFFTCTGTEANDLAIRQAMAATGNRGVIALRHAYHGNSSSVHRLSTHLTGGAAHIHDIAFVEPPNRHDHKASPHRDTPPDFADLIDEAVDLLSESGEGVAAFICDAIFDSQGALEAPPEYFVRVYEKVRAAGGVCIADEVQAGFARTGKMWGFENYGVVPDIVTLGKPMGGGYPMGAVVTSDSIAQAFLGTSYYFNTFAGTPVAARAGLVVLETIIRDALVEHVRVTGEYLKHSLEETVARTDQLSHVRGMGLFLGVEFVNPEQLPDRNAAQLVCERLKARCVLAGTSGRYGNVLKVRPPLVFKKDHVELFLQAFESALEDVL